MIIAWQPVATVRRLGSSQMTASSRMVCLIVFTSNVANTSAAMCGATTTSGVLLKIRRSRVPISSRKLTMASPHTSTAGWSSTAHSELASVMKSREA